MESKIMTDLPMSDYLKHPAVGSSSLKNILQSPADYKAALEMPSQETTATKLGTATHTAILEPEKFDEEYLCEPEDWGPHNVGEGKKKWDALKKQAKEEGKTPFAWKDTQYLNRVRESAKDHEALQMLLSGGKPEVTAWAKIGDHNYKARVDWLTHQQSGLFDSCWVWDLKTSSKGMDDNSLSRTIFNNGYHFQAAHHTQVLKAAGIDVKGWGWIFVSTDTPYPHIVMRKASPALLAAGYEDWKYAKRLLEQCTKDDQWPGFAKLPLEIDLPQWAEKDYG